MQRDEKGREAKQRATMSFDVLITDCRIAQDSQKSSKDVPRSREGQWGNGYSYSLVDNPYCLLAHLLD